MTWLRISIGVLIALAIGVALVPLAVLVDLKDGGSGWGLCPQGLDVCRSSYFAGFELFAGLVVVLAVVLAAIHLCVKLLRRIDRRQAARTFLARQQAALAQQQGRPAARPSAPAGVTAQPVATTAPPEGRR